MKNKDYRIQNELDRISKVFETVPDNRQTVIDPLLSKLCIYEVDSQRSSIRDRLERCV